MKTSDPFSRNESDAAYADRLARAVGLGSISEIRSRMTRLEVRSRIADAVDRGDLDPSQARFLEAYLGIPLYNSVPESVVAASKRLPVQG